MDNTVVPSCTKILIAGSRTITDYAALSAAISGAITSKVLGPAQTFEIVSGGAQGVDTLAERYARESGYVMTVMRPIYRHNNDRGAPLRRNEDLGRYADVLIAVWDGVSPGTKHMIEFMRKSGKPVYVHYT